jgi:predicted phosphoribosyltransferase
MFERFDDRKEGGRALAAKLSRYKNRSDVVVLALPRGGVPVAFEVARALNAPLDLLIVRKLGVPGQEELAFGAIASGGVTVYNEALVSALNMSEPMIEKVLEAERNELDRREKMYRKDRAPLDLRGKTVIIIDDGLATGATMRAALAAVKKLGPNEVIAAAPVASRGTCDQINERSDGLCICAMMPEPFYGVGMWYRNFNQTTDAEVTALLEKAEKGTQVSQAA